MPLGCDCFPGCWGHHSVDWVRIPLDEAKASPIKCGVPYGSYVTMRDHYRIETEELAKLVRKEPEMTSTNLTFARVSEINLERCNHWHSLEDWSATQWALAFAGEAGEVCNAIKKLNRFDMGIQQNAVSASREELLKDIATEIGDTYLYMDLLCQRLGINIEFAIIDTFNRVSKRENLEERLP